MKRFLGFSKVVETLFFACFGLWLWLAVSVAQLETCIRDGDAYDGAYVMAMRMMVHT
jgi:hypothetical protein